MTGREAWREAWRWARRQDGPEPAVDEAVLNAAWVTHEGPHGMVYRPLAWLVAVEAELDERLGLVPRHVVELRDRARAQLGRPCMIRRTEIGWAVDVDPVTLDR